MWIKEGETTRTTPEPDDSDKILQVYETTMERKERPPHFSTHVCFWNGTLNRSVWLPVVFQAPKRQLCKACVLKRCSILCFDTLPVRVWAHLHLAELISCFQRRGAGRGWKPLQHSLKALKGLSGHIKLCFQEINEPEWGRSPLKWKEIQAFVTCNTFGKPKLNISLDKPTLGLFSSSFQSLVSYTELSVNAEEVRK